ncbi:MAG: adenylyltransferase/cytidyltransferase family protein [Lacisediminimonas sp.]|nr:adenylyltransferase/cytidyltransferase family protein [Lacisediminimonas sp.]
MPDFERKICDRAQLSARLAALPGPVVLTNGVFDILHRGHVTYLAQARALGGSLVVAVNTDDSVRRLGKGSDRPINTCEDRMAVLAALESVSLVVAFAEDTALETVLHSRPDIYAKGGDYDMDAIPEGRAVKAYGGQAVAIDFTHDRSTSKLLQKVRVEADAAARQSGDGSMPSSG